MPVADGAQVTQAWMRSAWQIQVPQTWLDACVEWVMEEAGGVDLPQAQLNQQVLDQWLLADLHDLAHPVLPAGVSETRKTELNGCYCLQVDSLLDVSQPAYSLLQRVRGSDCSNEEVTAVTQATQKPWEAKPTRMLMLQLTDGVQSLEGMEYRPTPALTANLPPGTKLQVVGSVMVRLGVLLLKPENVRVLGGEVEQLLERHSQSRVLCRTLGLPEEDHQQRAEAEDQEVQQGGRIQGTMDSGYESNATSLNSQMIGRNGPHQPENSRLSPLLQTTPISRPSGPNVVDVPDEDFDDIPDYFNDYPEDFGNIPDDFGNGPEHLDNSPEDFNNYPEDFDDIPMEELDNMMSPTDPEFLPSSGSMEHRGTQQQDVPNSDSVQPDSQVNQPRASNHLYLASRTSINESTSLHATSSDEIIVIPDADDTFPSPEPKMARYEPREQVPAHDRSKKAKADTSILNYLCILQAGVWPPPSAQVVRLQAFIVTLLGNLRSSGGEWKLGATISDGTGYLNVDLSDSLLANLIGFSASESRVLRKDPAKRGVVDTGIQKCQRELVDMCCVMSVRVDPNGTGTVLRTDPVTDRECCELQRRVTERRS